MVLDINESFDMKALLAEAPSCNQLYKSFFLEHGVYTGIVFTFEEIKYVVIYLKHMKKYHCYNIKAGKTEASSDPIQNKLKKFLPINIADNLCY